MFLLRVLPCFFALLFAFSTSASAQVVEDIVITNTAQGYDLEVKFYIPLHYQSHFPKKSGNSFEILMRPENFANPNLTDGMANRGNVSWDRAKGVPLGEIVFDGEMPNSPKIIARFVKEVQFSVRNSADLRSLFISVDTRGVTNTPVAQTVATP